ncbi:MAG: dihydropteroate synthase [Bacteroidota bacterium]
MRINCNGKTLDLSSPAVMGILNVTPDSFFDGGKYDSGEKILQQVEKMIREGASLIDVGAVSTRPGSAGVTEEAEEQRLLPVIALIRSKHPDLILSADTWRSSVAEKAAAAGADIINDISGGAMDPAMLDTVAGLGLPYILMHIKGTPADMQRDPQYTDVVEEVMDHFIRQSELALSRGVKQIILDPGFGFGKTAGHNYRLLNNLSRFRLLGFPLLAGVSRKSMINTVIGTRPENALNGTTVVNTLALMNGADILRVHDVREATEAVKIVTFARKV